jgi:hypothetical protein
MNTRKKACKAISEKEIQSEFGQFFEVLADLSNFLSSPLGVTKFDVI